MSVPFGTSLLFSFLFFLLGIAVGKKTFVHSVDVTLENAHTKSVIFYLGSIFLLLCFVVGVLFIRNDTLLVQTPLLFQKFSTLYVWSIFSALITFASAYIFSLAFLLKKRISTYLPSLLLLNILFFILFFRVNQPIYSLVSSQPPQKKGFLQSTNYSCTSASIATIALRYGKDIDEKKVATISGLTKFGATTGQIRYTLNSLGLEYKDIINVYSKLKQIPAPALIFIDHPSVGKEGHVVVYEGYDEGRYRIWDPLQGERSISAEQMEKIWHGNGVSVYKRK